MQITTRLLLAAALLCAALSAQQPAALTAPESRILAAVDAETPAAQAFLQQIVEINSGTMNFAGVRQVGAKLEPRFQALGFKTHWVNMDAVNRAGHLIAEHPCPAAAACGRGMLLIGHMDTVFSKDSPFQHWALTADPTVATGPGTNDMKGGLVVMLMALDAMQASGVLKNTDITVVLSGDEESEGSPSSIARHDMIEASKHADVALEFENTPRVNGLYYASISRRSASTWTLTATGNTGHSSGIFSPGMGFGAIYELTRILDDFRKELPEQYLTFNIGTIAGGATVTPGTETGTLTAAGKTNIVPPTAEALGDLRTISDAQTEAIRTKMRAIVARHLPGTSAEIVFRDAYPAMAPTEASRALLKILSGANQSLGLPVMPELDPMQRGAGDIAFVAHLPGIAGIGATGSGAHAAGETIDLPSQPINAKRDALFMYRLSLQK